LLPSLATFVVFRSIGSSVSKGIRLQSSTRNILSCTYAPPRRFNLKPAVALLQTYVNRKVVSIDTLLFKLFGLSAFPDSKALLFTSLERRRPRIVALIRGSHTLGFGYPLDVLLIQLSNPWRPLSAPNALRLRPSKLFSKPMIEEEFPLLSPLLRFSKKPFGLLSALQRLTPISSAVPLLATQSISLGRGRLLP